MIYFDNAATTFPKPASVLRAAEEAVCRYGGNPGRGGHAMAMRVSEKIYEVRSAAARFFGAEPENVAFTLNCTMALNTAIKGTMQKGGHIIISCLEHNAVLRPVYKLFCDGVCEYDVAGVCEGDDEATVRAFEKLIRKDTRAIVCTHASNVTGTVLPVARLGKLCEAYGLCFIVDAAQSAGVLPISMEEMSIDFLCMPGHKGLYGLTGSGMLIGNGRRELGTLMEGGTGSRSIELSQPDFSPDRFEAGTVNTVGILSMGAGMEFIRRRGMKEIYRHEYELCREFGRGLSAIPGAAVPGGEMGYGRRAPIVSFNLEGIAAEALAQLLSDEGFALRGGLHCAPLAHEHYHTLETGTVRFAPSAFSSRSQVSCLLCKLQNIREKQGKSLEL